MWEFFEKELGTKTAKCHYCSEIISCKDGNTTTMRRHLNLHPVEFEKLMAAEKERQDENERQAKKAKSGESKLRQPTLNQFQTSFTK